MCLYIKDDGEQCGRETELYCHQHEDTIQADYVTRVADTFDGDFSQSEVLPVFAKGIEDAIEDVRSEVASQSSSTDEVSTTCDECKAPLRRTIENVRQLGYNPSKTSFGEVVHCDCTAMELEPFTVESTFVPDEWRDD